MTISTLNNTEKIQRKYRGNTEEIQRKYRGNTEKIQRKYRENTEEIQRKYTQNPNQADIILSGKYGIYIVNIYKEGGYQSFSIEIQRKYSMMCVFE